MTHVRKPHQILCLLVLFTFPSLAVAQEETASIELPRPATTATEETPSWFSVGAAYRFRFENREASGFREGNDDGYGLSQILIDIGIKPTSWLNFHFQGQDARAPGKENANGVFRDPFDVRQAWVEIGDPKKGWIHARVGRQELLYGGQRLIGPLAWTNTARQFDAAKVTVGKDDLGFDVFAASVVQIDPTGFNRHRDENNLHGIYGRLNRLVPGSKLEAFILLKTTPPRHQWKRHAGRCRYLHGRRSLRAQARRRFRYRDGSGAAVRHVWRGRYFRLGRLLGSRLHTGRRKAQSALFR